MAKARKNSTPRAPRPTIRPRGTVAIVGRPNVGKSALFNRIARRRISIVHDEAGVTRDRIATVCEVGDTAFELIDTGGIGSDINDNFDDAVRAEADIAIHTANLILFVVDGQSGITTVDRQLAATLRQSEKPILVVVNKIDIAQHEGYSDEFTQLGFSNIIGVSAVHGRGIDELTETIIPRLAKLCPTPMEIDEENDTTGGPKIALVGRPNVGKSSLVNSLLHSARTIVSKTSGTTRDAVDIPFQRGDKHYTLIDTAGIRAKGRHRTSVEVFSVMRSEKSIERANLCILVLDASEGLTTQDKKIAGLIQKAEKPCLIVLNKWDLIKGLDEKEAKTRILEEIRHELFFLSYAPLVLLSARSGEYIGRVFDVVESIREQARRRISTGQLNRILKDILETNPPPLQGKRRFKILYGTQVENNTPIPAPTLMLFVNDAKLLPPPYTRYLDAKIRKVIPYDGLPILIRMRGRPPREKAPATGKNQVRFKGRAKLEKRRKK